MYRQILLYLTLSLLVYLATGSNEKLLLEDEAKMLRNNELLSDKKAKVDGEAIILSNTDVETGRYSGNDDIIFENESSADVKEKLSKAYSKLLNDSEDITAESRTTDPIAIEKKLLNNITMEVTDADVANISSNFEADLKASGELLRHLNGDFNITLATKFTQQLSNDSDQYITTDTTTENEIKSTVKSSYNVNLNSNEANYFQLSDIVDILNITTETVNTLDPNELNSDTFSSIVDSTDRSDELATAEFSTDRSDNDIISKEDVTTYNGNVEAREMESGGISDVTDQENLIYSSQNVTSSPVVDSTTGFKTTPSSNTETTFQTPIEPTTESVLLIKISETISTRSSSSLDTSEIREFKANTALENKTELPTQNSNENLVSERRKNNETDINLIQTTTSRSTEMDNLITTATTKLPPKNFSRSKQTLLPVAWYTNLIPIYPSYLINPFNYFYNSTNQTRSGTSSQPTTRNYTTLLKPPTFNFANVLRQILLPEITPTARHLFRQTQSNITQFHFFPFFKLFNATQHFNKTKLATNTQTEAPTNISDVLSALLHHKHAKFQQRQTEQGNDDDDGSLFVRRQWYTPLVSDNLERSEGVPFLTPVVRYRNQGQQLLTPVITYVERSEPYRIERPQYYRERPKLKKRPTTNYHQQPYYHERPYNIEHPYQVEQPSYYHQPVKTDVRVQSGPISYESSPMDLTYIEPIIDIDDGEVEYYYRSKQLNATSLKSAEDTSKQGATTSRMLEVEVSNPIYKFMKSIYNPFMPNN